jgi:hypothetical protein
MFEELRSACVAVFTVSIPLLAVVRFKSKFPVWLLIILSIALGWFLPYTHMSMREPMIRQADREHTAMQEEYERHPWPVTSATDPAKNPFSFGDFVPEPYHPVASLAYGPVYLMGCWLAAWLYFCRSGSGQRRQVLVVSVGVVLVEWAALFGYVVKSTPRNAVIDTVLFNWWDRFFGPQLTLPLAMIVAWLVAAWLPTTAAAKLKRSIKRA